VWFRRLLHPRPQTGRRGRSERLAFELDAVLSAQLRLAARARQQSTERLITDMLVQGLERETLRQQAEAALSALTEREQEVARLAARGRTNRQIAEALFISTETVKTHMHNVLDKFDVHSKADLRLLLLDLGIRWWGS
jgi:DNA-binding NarL/FixJ family response regulator